MHNSDDGTFPKKIRQWYYVVGIELETIVEADYPANAHDCLHDTVHRLLDHLDRHRWPRVVCNLVQNVDGWELMDPKLSAVTFYAKKNVRPVKETTFVGKRKKVPKS